MKLNNKIKKLFLIILIGIITIILSISLYVFIDYILNGSFVDWFEKNYMITEYKYLAEAGQETLVHSIIWYKFKALLLWILIISSLIWVTVIVIVSRSIAKKRERKLITEISQKLRIYMNGNIDINDIFSKEQSEISAQITEIKSTLLHNEQILKEETNRKNDLIAYLAHDLKTPLTSVIGYLSILDEIDDMPKQQQKKYIDVALDKSYRLEELINEFFEIARFNDTKIVLMKKNLNLKFMLQQLIDEFYPITNEQNKNIVINCDDKIMCYADPDKLSRVFNNIIKNAISYGFENTEIQINVSCDTEFITISIQNDGYTIPEDKLNSIFEKFYRLDSSRNTRNGGAGLGLAIAKEIITLHGGTITAKSNNNITTFILTIPQK